MSSVTYLPGALEQLGDYRKVLSSLTPMWIFDRKTLQILEVNEAATEVYGYSRSEFLNMTILDIRPLEDIPKVLQSAWRARDNKPTEPVWRHQKKDGTVFPANVKSWEITFDGHQAALVLTEAVRGRSVGN